MNIQLVPITQIKPNPNNPRLIKDDKFEKLVKSVKEFPQMLEIRPIVVNDKMIVLGGNMRLRACQEAGYKEIPIIKASDLTEEQQKEFIVKDNIGFGEWDWNELANNWDTNELSEWGLDIPGFDKNEYVEQEQIEPSGYDTELAWLLNITCDNEEHAQKLYEKFINEGLNVKIIN